MRRYVMGERQGNLDMTPPIADYVNAYALLANTAVTVTWPADADKCNIVGDPAVPYYVRVGGTAVVPTTTITDGTASAQNVAQRMRQAGEASFSIVAGDATLVTIEFWSNDRYKEPT